MPILYVSKTGGVVEVTSLGISTRKGHNIGNWVLSNFWGGQEKQAHIYTHASY